MNTSDMTFSTWPAFPPPSLESGSMWKQLKQGKVRQIWMLCGWQRATAPISAIQSPQALIGLPWTSGQAVQVEQRLGTYSQGLFPAARGVFTLVRAGSTQNTHAAYTKAHVCSRCVLPLRCQKKWFGLFAGLCFIKNKCFRQDFDNQTKQNALAAASCKAAPSLHPAPWSVRNSTSIPFCEEREINRRNPHVCFENLSYLKHLFCKATPALTAPLRHRETELLHKDVPVLLSWGKSCKIWSRNKSVPWMVQSDKFFNNTHTLENNSIFAKYSCPQASLLRN